MFMFYKNKKCQNVVWILGSFIHDATAWTITPPNLGYFEELKHNYLFTKTEISWVIRSSGVAIKQKSEEALVSPTLEKLKFGDQLIFTSFCYSNIIILSLTKEVSTKTKTLECIFIRVGSIGRDFIILFSQCTHMNPDKL